MIVFFEKEFTRALLVFRSDLKQPLMVDVAQVFDKLMDRKITNYGYQKALDTMIECKKTIVL